MPVRRTSLLGVVAVAVTLVGFTACGDAASTDDPSTNDTGSAAAVAPTDTVTTPVTGSEPAPGGQGPGSGTPFCDLQNKLNTMATPFENPNATAADYQEFYIEVVADALDQSAMLAPVDLQDEVAKVNEGIAALGDAMEANGWDPAAAYNDPRMAPVFADSSYDEANQTIDSYCGN